MATRSFTYPRAHSLILPHSLELAYVHTLADKKSAAYSSSRQLINAGPLFLGVVARSKRGGMIVGVIFGGFSERAYKRPRRQLVFEVQRVVVEHSWRKRPSGDSVMRYLWNELRNQVLIEAGELRMRLVS